MPSWLSVRHGLQSHTLRDCLQPNICTTLSKTLPAHAASRDGGLNPSFCSLPALTECLLSSATTYMCLGNNTVVSQGEVSSSSAGSRCFHPPLQLISSPVLLQHTAASALPAQLGECLEPALSKTSPQEIPACAGEVRACRPGYLL